AVRLTSSAPQIFRPVLLPPLLPQELRRYAPIDHKNESTKRSRTTRQLRSLKKSGRCRHVTKEVKHNPVPSRPVVIAAVPLCIEQLPVVHPHHVSCGNVTENCPPVACLVRFHIALTERKQGK